MSQQDVYLVEELRSNKIIEDNFDYYKGLYQNNFDTSR